MTTVEPVAEATPIDRAKGPYRRTHMLAAVVLIGLIAALWACSLPWYHFEMHNVTVETPSYQKVTVNVSTYKSGFALAHATQPTNDTIGQGPIQGPAGPPALAGMPIAAAMLMMVGAFILLGVITKLGLLSVLGF